MTESSQGIIPYKTEEEGKANAYIKPRREVLPTETDWKPLLDGNGFIGRYEMRWASTQPYLKYGPWLWRLRKAKYFENPKLLVVRLRNKSLKRRLVATYDDTGFFNRDNYNNIIAQDKKYELKYILALFNSSLLNCWYSRNFDNVNINPDTFRQIPIYPAQADTQSQFITLVDDILAKQAELNTLRAQGYTIRQRRDATALIEVPYDKLLYNLMAADINYPTLTFFDARATGMFSIPQRCDLQATVSSNVYIPAKFPTTLVLRHNKLWLEVPDDGLRRYLYGYVRRPQWSGKTWDNLKDSVLVPENTDALNALFEIEMQQVAHITTLLDEIKRIDIQIDELVLDLYGITDQVDRQRILGSAPVEEEEMDASSSDDL